MSKKVKLSFVATLALSFLAIYSYGHFSEFRPKSLVPAKEVKGIKVEDDRVKLPYPSDYEMIGTSTKNGNKQITFRTGGTPEGTQSFYRNVMLSKDWEIDSTGSVGIFTTTTYVQDKKEVSVTTSLQANEDQDAETLTIVSLLIKD